MFVQWPKGHNTVPVYAAVFRIRDPVLFYPLDLESGSVMNFFRISDPGSGPFLGEIFFH
jgi:hypothetical protein